MVRFKGNVRMVDQNGNEELILVRNEMLDASGGGGAKEYRRGEQTLWTKIGYQVLNLDGEWQVLETGQIFTLVDE